MNEIANQLVQSLFKKNSLQDCSRWELEILAEHYPYFGLAQLLVASKLKDEDSEAYKKQVQKTSLYFTNPLWLDYILNKKTSSTPGEIINGEAAENAYAQPAVDTTPATETTPSPSGDGDFTADDTNGLAEIQLAAADLQQITEQAGADTAEETTSAERTIEPEQTPADIPLKDPAHIVELPAANASVNESVDVPGASQPALEANTGDAADNAGEIKIAPLNSEPLPGDNTPLIFEAFHTVDYFASQGIKLSLEEKPQDRFGQQLKSFTQWLKTIKKTPPAEIVKEAGTGTEQKVITLAEHSIADREVVTEAMAEVWLKQGNQPKAIEVYHKLSLQNPAKSSYFAGLIEQLKQH